jgi:Ferric reductase like transmembrane component/FAD-binding domain
MLIVFGNVLAAGIGHRTFQPTTYYPKGSPWEITVYLANRCGVLALVNFMILALMAGRNNILLWLTNWPHSTYLLLHRWVAYCCILEAVLHSLVWLSRAMSNHNHADRVKSPYWIWGIVATVSFSLILFTSVLPIRQRLYELFLACHIILALLALVGVWQHIWFKFTRDLGSYGYEIWIFLTMAFWALDHVIRYLRIAKNGIGRAQITVLDDDYIQIDVRGVEVEGHVYLYFPTLSWRFWENHPFSVYSSALSDQIKDSSSTPESLRSQENSFTEDVEKSRPTLGLESVGSRDQQIMHPGFSLLVRTMSGATSHLRYRQSLPVLVEGSYHKPKPPSPHCHLVAVAGGVGLTAVLPTLTAHQGSKKLYWGSRAQSLVDQVALHLANMEVEIAVGRRLDLPSILKEELKGSGNDVVVLVCGPSEMADEVRAIVSTYVRKGERNIHLEDESFGW